ncbi:SCP2 sterol-binding domain-containing protein [Micromonospora cathayae]|uniref:SCP2 sterol-binding domain-containing protein n=1 Tax=Micromonospora cathayae TaxID=3028804 RepID=A0ABY7ZS00_9ACTN|nr:SCP2 sterol-binding domain-containing protein [Micromonospora sp. HUAS 3]WDZ85546.1 SCP2 sterol-binding domain-containing protein [Micromonospora sp. HUAS 3]
MGEATERFFEALPSRAPAVLREPIAGTIQISLTDTGHTASTGHTEDTEGTASVERAEGVERPSGTGRTARTEGSAGTEDSAGTEGSAGTAGGERSDGTGRSEQWYVELRTGAARVSHDPRPADAVMYSSPDLFDRLVTGEAQAIAAMLRNETTFSGNVLLFLVFRRFFPDPPGTRDPRETARERGGPRIRPQSGRPE